MATDANATASARKYVSLTKGCQKIITYLINKNFRFFLSMKIERENVNDFLEIHIDGYPCIVVKQIGVDTMDH